MIFRVQTMAVAVSCRPVGGHGRRYAACSHWSQLHRGVQQTGRCACWNRRYPDFSPASDCGFCSAIYQLWHEHHLLPSNASESPAGPGSVISVGCASREAPAMRYPFPRVPSSPPCHQRPSRGQRFRKRADRGWQAIPGALPICRVRNVVRAARHAEHCVSTVGQIE